MLDKNEQTSHQIENNNTEIGNLIDFGSTNNLIDIIVEMGGV